MMSVGPKFSLRGKGNGMNQGCPSAKGICWKSASGEPCKGTVPLVGRFREMVKRKSPGLPIKLIPVLMAAKITPIISNW